MSKLIMRLERLPGPRLLVTAARGSRSEIGPIERPRTISRSCGGPVSAAR